MYVKNKMTKNPIVIDVNSNINATIDLMSEHDLHRLPVVKDNKLVGLITKSTISKSGANKATSLSIFELNYLLSKTTIGTVMVKDVITIKEDDLLEEAALLMKKNDIGCLPVVNDENETVGILTQNDLFGAFLDLLGYNEIGSRVCIDVEDNIGVIGEISKVFVRNNANISHIGVYRDCGCQLVVRVDILDTKALEDDLNSSGYKVISVLHNQKCEY